MRAGTITSKNCVNDIGLRQEWRQTVKHAFVTNSETSDVIFADN